MRTASIVCLEEVTVYFLKITPVNQSLRKHGLLTCWTETVHTLKSRHEKHL